MRYDSLLRRFFRNIFWNLFGTVGVSALNFVAALVAGRLLGKEGFGELGIIQSTVLLLSTFAGFGLGLTSTKYIAELKDKDPKRTGRIIAINYFVAFISGAIMTLVCFAAAKWLARETLNAPHLAGMLQISSILLFVNAISGVQNGSLAGFQSFRIIAGINILQGFLTLPLTIFLVYWVGLQGAVLSLIFSAIIRVISSSIALRYECAAAGIRLEFRESWKEYRILWIFAFPALLSGCLSTPVIWAGNAILVNQPQGYAQMGLFNAANQFRMLILFVPNIIGMVTVPLLSEIHGQNSPVHFAQAINANLRTLWAMAIPFGFLVIGFSSWLIRLFGPEFQGGQTVLALMACISICYVASATVGQALIGSGKMWIGFLLNLGWSAIFLPLVLYLAPTKGAEGLAQAYFISYSFLTLATLSYIGIRFGRIGVQYTPGLIFLTSIIYFLALNMEKFKENLMIGITLLLTCLSAIWGWRILPLQGRQQIYKFMGYGSNGIS